MHHVSFLNSEFQNSPGLKYFLIADVIEREKKRKKTPILISHGQLQFYIQENRKKVEKMRYSQVMSTSKNDSQETLFPSSHSLFFL